MKRALTFTDISSTLAMVVAVGCGTSAPGRPGAERFKGPAVSGIVIDEAGMGVPDQLVQACTTRVCFTGRTDAGGRFLIGGLDSPEDVIVKTPESDEITPFRAESIAPVHLVDDSVVDVGTLHMATLPAAVVLAPPGSDPQTVTLGDGLTLTLRRSDLMMPPGVTQNDRLAARSIPPAHVPKLADLGAEKVVVAYALFPFATKSKSKVAVRLPTALAAGTKVHLRTVGELDGKLSVPESGTSDGQFVVSDPGTGIVDFTWLVVSRETNRSP